MTPCCRNRESLKSLKNFNYCQKELEEILIDNDFHCPNCDTEDIYLDKLIRNESLETALKQFIETSNTEDSSGMKRKFCEAFDEPSADSNKRRQST